MNIRLLPVKKGSLHLKHWLHITANIFSGLIIMYEEYFDLAKDPFEMNNLINQPGYDGEISENEKPFC